MIESTRRFGARAGTRLPPWRFTAKTRKRGLPVSLYARESLQVASVQQHGLGWIEWDVGGVHLLVVHAIAPYLPWRWSVRERQLLALAHRLNAIHARDPDRPAIALGDFNTADFEPVWRRMEGRIDHWRRLDIDGPLEPTRRRRRRHGTWPFGGVWAPICVDHVMAAPTIYSVNEGARRPRVRTFHIPGSDHLGLVVDVPALSHLVASHAAPEQAA